MRAGRREEQWGAAWICSAAGQPSGLHLSSLLTASTSSHSKSQPRKHTQPPHSDTSHSPAGSYSQWAASINVQAVNQWRCGGSGPNAGVGGGGVGWGVENNKNKVLSQSARQMWWRGSYFGSLTLWKGVLWSTLSAPLPLCRSPPCAHVGERLKPERRWCHGPDVKKARWPLAPLLRPPSSSSTHPAKTGGAHAVQKGQPPPHAEAMENGVEKWAIMRRNWGDITASNGGRMMVPLFRTVIKAVTPLNGEIFFLVFPDEFNVFTPLHHQNVSIWFGPAQTPPLGGDK